MTLAFTQPASADSHGPTIGAPAPDFSLSDTNGVRHSLSDFKGNIVVLEWTNPECPFVKKHYETGNMQGLQEKAVASGVTWLTINSSAQGKQGYMTAEEANSYIAEEGSRETARLVDSSGEVGHLYGALTTPHMFVIDANGTLAYKGAIDDNPSADPVSVAGAKNYVTAALASLAAGKPIENAETRSYGCGVKY
jgi:peroxiredoxin